MGLAVRVFDAVGVGVAVNLSGGTTTHAKNQASEFEQVKSLRRRALPRALPRVHEPRLRGLGSSPTSRSVRSRRSKRARASARPDSRSSSGSACTCATGRASSCAIDDPKLDPMWRRLGELGMPVSIHVADPKAFWEPYDEHNERWTELKDHPRVVVRRPEEVPRRAWICCAALERVIARHPETTFVCVHMGNNAEDLDWVDAQLDAHPNMRVDIAARVPEFGRARPGAGARVLREARRPHPLRHRLPGLRPDDRSARAAAVPRRPRRTPSTSSEKHWRFFETADRDFPHMTPIQGDWTISGIAPSRPTCCGRSTSRTPRSSWRDRSRRCGTDLGTASVVPGYPRAP